jgi:hypothetical protein
MWAYDRGAKTGEQRHCVGRFYRSRGRQVRSEGIASVDFIAVAAAKVTTKAAADFELLLAEGERRHCVGRFYRSRGKGWLEIGRIDSASKLACRRGINPIRSVESVTLASRC